MGREISLSVVLIVITGLLIGCETVSQKPPEGALTVNPVRLPTGTKFIVRTQENDSEKLTTYTVLGPGKPFNDVDVIRRSDDTKTYIFHAETLNWMATLDADGELESSVTPHSGTYDWPLWVGKSWITRSDYTDHVRERSWSPIVTHWAVEIYEPVTVPAGTFEAFRLQSKPGMNNSTQDTLWYAPELGISVKRVFERMSNHYLGPAHQTFELVSIDIPE